MCNIVYAHMVAGGDQEMRDKFDRDLNAPAVGWDVVQRRIAERFKEG